MSSVKASSRYEDFVIPTWQRPLDRKKVDRLKEKISEKNLSHSFPITVKITSAGKKLVIDGQHRFNALKELEKPVPFVVTTDHFHVSDLIEASKDTKSWSVRDVLESFSARRKLGYRFIKSVIEEYELKDAAIRVLTSNFTTDEYNNGDVTYSHEEMQSIRNFLDFAKEFNETLDNPDTKKRAVFAALWKLYNSESFSQSRMLLRTKTYPNKFHYYSSMGESFEMLRSIYNYRTKVVDQI